MAGALAPVAPPVATPAPATVSHPPTGCTRPGSRPAPTSPAHDMKGTRVYSNFLIVPDSFKGTMSAIDVCRIMAETLQERFPDAAIRTIPVADGGEGSVDAFLAALPGRRMEATVCGPYRESMTAHYGLLDNGTAVIEMAAAAGLPLVGENRHVEKTTTYGVGQLLLDALEHGATRVIMGLGGSATNDGGCGMAAACGVRFLDETGEAFMPVGETLSHIARIDMRGLDPRVRDVEIVTMCDIDNPLCGPTGAAAVFGPQKGASPSQVRMLDEGLAHLAGVILSDLRRYVLGVRGGGAAGGMGAGMVAFFGSPLQMGIQTVLDTVGFDELARAADLVFSGEGCFDSQSLHGKVVVGVASRCKQVGTPLIAVAGAIDDTAIPAAVEAGVTHLCCINRTGVPISVALKHPRSNLAHTMGLLSELLATRPLGELPARIHLRHDGLANEASEL